MTTTRAADRRKSRIATFGIAVAVLIAASPASSQANQQELVPRLAPGPLIEALRDGGYTILIRHMATQAFNPDLTTFDPDDCTTQRNLSDLGRRQAEQMGEAFRKLGIKVDLVLSSPYCRCMDTGVLAFGADAVQTSSTLLVGASKAGHGSDDPGIAIRQLLDTPPEPGTNTVLIAHSVTLLYAFGLTSRPEGVAHVFRPTDLGLGRPDYIGMVKPDEWPLYAGLDSEGATEMSVDAEPPDANSAAEPVSD